MIIDRMPRPERHADFALRFHSPDARAVTGARINHDDRWLKGIDRSARWRDNPHKRVVDRPLKGASIQDKLSRKAQHIRDILGRLSQIRVSPLVERVEEKYAALPGVRPVVCERAEWEVILRHELTPREPSEAFPSVGRATII